MDSLFIEVLELTRSGLLGMPISPDTIISDWNRILDIAEWQGIVSIIDRAVRISHLAVPNESHIRLKSDFLQYIRIDRFQQSELNRLFQLFDENEIDYLPVKGVVMKSYYPSSVYRWMIDADIFIKMAQYDRLSKILSDEGYSFFLETDYELKWKKAGFVIEFHKAAVNTDVGEFAAQLGDVFDKAIRSGSSHRYELDKTDELIYSVVHFAKHYINGGVRLKSLIDLYYLWKRGGEDDKKLEAALTKMNLFEFYKVLKSTTLNWFAGVPFDEKSEMIMQGILSESTEYRNSRKYIYRAAKGSQGKKKITRIARIKTILKRLFIPMEMIPSRYAIIRKFPPLLPFFWVWRVINAVLFRRKRLKKYMDIQLKDTEQYVKEYLGEMKQLGLENVVVPKERNNTTISSKATKVAKKTNATKAAKKTKATKAPNATTATKPTTSPLMTPREKVLVKALSGDMSFAESAHLLTDNMNADKENSLYLLSLGIVGFHQGWKYFPGGLIPRIRGIHRYYQVENSVASPWLKARLAILENASIPFILTGGTAMRAHYAPDTPRMMNGYDITVRSEDYETASSLLRSDVRAADPQNPFERTISGRTVLRLHKGVPDARLFSEKEFWTNAEPSVYLGHKVLVPSSADMLLHLLCIPFAPFIYDEDHTDRVRRLAESCIVISSGVSYQSLAQIAKKVGLTDVVRYYLVLLTELVPNIIDRKNWEPFFPDNLSYRLFVRKLEWLGRIRPGKKRRDLSLRFARRAVRKHITNRRISK